MPYSSDAQRRWAHTPTGEKALGGPGKVQEWDQASKGANLPERIGVKKKGPVMIRKAGPKMRTDVMPPVALR